MMHFSLTLLVTLCQDGKSIGVREIPGNSITHLISTETMQRALTISLPREKPLYLQRLEMYHYVCQLHEVH